MPLKLNLGCSDDHRVGFVNVDIAQPADFVADLNKPWPWEDGSVEYILALDVFEHIHGCYQFFRDSPFGARETHLGNGKIHCMNEAHRVLEPGGILELAVPCVHMADGRVNPGAFADPTHRTFWTVDDLYYFGEQWNNPEGERGRVGPAYGITALFRGSWTLYEYGNGAERRSKIRARLEAVKGGRTISPTGIPSGEGFGRV